MPQDIQEFKMLTIKTKKQTFEVSYTPIMDFKYWIFINSKLDCWPYFVSRNSWHRIRNL